MRAVGRRVGRGFAESFNVKGFDRNRLTRLHGDFFYDRHHDIFLYEKAFKEAQAKEEQNSEAFFRELGYFDEYFAIQKTLKMRVTPSTQEPPELIGDYKYYTKTRVVEDYAFLTIQRRHVDHGRVEAVWDPLADGVVPKKLLNSHTLLASALDDGHQRIALSLDLKSDELPTGVVKDLASKRVFPER